MVIQQYIGFFLKPYLFYGSFVLFFTVALKVLLVDLPHNTGQLFKEDRARLLAFLQAIGQKREEMGLEHDPRLAEASSELSSSDRSMTTRESVSRLRSN